MPVFYESPWVRITESRITIMGTDYPVRNISAVQVVRGPGPWAWVAALVIFGLTIGSCGGCVSVGSLGDLDLTFGLVVLAIGVVLLLSGIAVAVLTKPAYHLVFQTNAGGITAYSTKDQAGMAAIKMAVDQAIDLASRGW